MMPSSGRDRRSISTTSASPARSTSVKRSVLVRFTATWRSVRPASRRRWSATAPATARPVSTRWSRSCSTGLPAVLVGACVATLVDGSPLGHGSEGEDGDDRHPSRGDDRTDDAAETCEPAAVAVDLDVGDRVADEASAHPGDHDRDEGEHAHADRGQGGGGGGLDGRRRFGRGPGHGEGIVLAAVTCGSFGPSCPCGLHSELANVDTRTVNMRDPGMDRETDGASQLVTVGTAATVPLRRLGTLRRDARLTAGDDITDIVGRCDGRFDVIDIRAIEAGEYRLTDEEVGDLLAIYGADPGDLLASRSTLVIDLEEGTVAAGNWTTSFAPETDGTDDILARYLALLYEMRLLEPGTPIPLRSLDVSVLSEALAMPARAVEQRLEILMVPGNRTLDRARRLLDRRILVPAAGLVVAATAVGVLL